MSQISFDQLPDQARLWVFAADRTLSETEKASVVHAVESGLAAWAAHGSAVRWGHSIIHDQFLMIGVDESQTELSGCSIDDATRKIQELETRLGISFLDNGRVFFRGDGAIRRLDRTEFGELAREGRVDRDTIVFNNIISTVGDLRANLWEVPISRSWHAEAFPVGS